MIKNDDIVEKLDFIEKQLKLNSSSGGEEKVSEEDLRRGTEIFTFLVLCPTMLSQRQVGWETFYRDLVQNHTARTIMMTMARVVSTVRESEKEEYNLAVKVLHLIWTTFGLKSLDLFMLSRGHKNSLKTLLASRYYSNSKCVNLTRNANSDDCNDYDILRGKLKSYQTLPYTCLSFQRSERSSTTLSTS